MVTAYSLASPIRAPGLRAPCGRRPAGQVRRALRPLAAQSDKPQGSRFRPERDESPPREPFAEEGQAAKRSETEHAEAPQQTQFDGEGPDYDMGDVSKYPKEHGGHGQEDGERGGKVGEEAGVQDVE